MNSFQLGMQFVGLHEWANKADGQYTNDPADPGGETKFGISKRKFPNEDIKNLTVQRAFEIYQTYYWGAFGLDGIPLPLCVAYFDSYVQHRETTVKDLIDKGQGDLQKFLEARRVFYLSLIDKNPKLIRFKNGWLNRINDLSKYCAIIMQ